jgi:hypothetical protein
MAEIRTAHLMTLTLAVAGMQAIGATPNGNRRIGLVAGGTFQGERLGGTVLPGGATGSSCAPTVPPRSTCAWCWKPATSR